MVLEPGVVCSSDSGEKKRSLQVMEYVSTHNLSKDDRQAILQRSSRRQALSLRRLIDVAPNETQLTLPRTHD